MAHEPAPDVLAVADLIGPKRKKARTIAPYVSLDLLVKDLARRTPKQKAQKPWRTRKTTK